MSDVNDVTREPQDADRDPAWQASVGSIPHKVTVFEMATRKRVLYLRWRERKNWAYESLKRDLYDEKGRRLTGRALKKMQDWAIGEAERKFAALKAGLPGPEKPKAPKTLGDTWALVSDEDSGLYPTDTPHRREVKRELRHMERILGSGTAWNAITDAELTKLWRRRIKELSADGSAGRRGAEITIARVLAVAAWLRRRKHIALTACIAPDDWQEQLDADWMRLTKAHKPYKPHQPRYTVEESRRLIAVAPKVDPRLELLLALGAELRGGQVARAKRSDLKLGNRVFECPGAGGKRGPVVYLTDGQMEAVRRALDPKTGYLRELEAAIVESGGDYPLFPAGQLPGGRALRRGRGTPPRGRTQRGRAGGKTPPSWSAPEHPLATVGRHLGAKPVGGSAIRSWLRDAELKAGITHVDGRGLYGMRRAAVDFAKAEKISREGLQAAGGWASTEIPDRIYADQEMGYAREEARDVRAKFRGEPGPVPPPLAPPGDPGNSDLTTERTTDDNPQRGTESDA